MKECVDSGSISECAMRQSVEALTKTLISSNDTVLLFLVLFGCFEFLSPNRSLQWQCAPRHSAGASAHCGDVALARRQRRSVDHLAIHPLRASAQRFGQHARLPHRVIERALDCHRPCIVERKLAPAERREARDEVLQNGEGRERGGVV